MTHPVNRREFGKRLAVGAAAVSTAGAIVADTDDEPAPPALPEDPASAKSDAPLSQSRLLLEVIRLRYPDRRLDQKALAGILRELRGDVVRSRILSSFSLQNQDEPAFHFAAYRSDG